MARRLTTPADLVDAGLVPPQGDLSTGPGDAPAGSDALARVAARYAIAITGPMADLIDPGDPDDRIARQFVPDARELVTTPEEMADPIGDDAHSPVPGVVHRYPDRALLKVVHACPVYCRFCFRRETVGPGGEHLAGPSLDAAMAYVRRTPALWEVILTGGDPLVLSPRRLSTIIGELAAIDHVGVVRLHSRVPVVDPARIDDRMIEALRAGRGGAATWLAVHTNHPAELTPDALAAIARLVDAGIALVSQTVLLKGVNDDPAVLEALLRTLVANRVKPYYLHHGDFAPGTGHFRTGIEDGRRIVGALRGRVSGLCQPAYVLDIPGDHGKVALEDARATGSDGTGWTVRDHRGNRHAYPPRPDDGIGTGTAIGTSGATGGRQED